MKIKITLSVITLGGALILAGCNTLKGAGQDIQNTGQALKNVATTSNQDKIITQQVQYRLKQQRYLADQSIYVSTANNTVTLTGHVTSIGQRNTAVRTAYQVKGVELVDDELIVQ